MRLLLDQGLPRTAAPLLIRQGHDAVHPGDVGLGEADDLEILVWARTQGRTVVTLDADFHRHLAAGHLHLPSVIRLRLEGLRAEALASLVLEVCDRAAEDLAAGAAVTVGEDRRCRRSFRSSISSACCAAVTVGEDRRCRIRRLPLLPRQPSSP